jgi:outer membrane protein OmpA-like peptidoglycan-associated protein/ubiquitin-protein ligase
MKSVKLIVFFALIVSLFSENEIEQSITPFTNLQKLSTQQKVSDCTQTISGKILNIETNLPIPSALVTLYLNGKEIKLVKVNSKGEFFTTLICDSNYKVKVSAYRYFNSTYKFKTSTKKNENLTKNILLEKECFQTLTGKITDALTKKIIDKATVTLYHDGEAITSLKTDSYGAYFFKIKCNTDYYIIANKLNFINDLFEFTASKNNGEVINHDFSIEPECIQTISGTILNKVTKEPISAQLKLYLNNVEVEAIQINNDGKYAIQFQCTTNYKIVASKPNYFDDSYNFLTDYIENKQPDYFHLKKDLFLEPNECFQIVSGKILEKNSKNIVPNSTVFLVFQNQEIKVFQTNNDGTYFFNVKCNSAYELKATKEGMLSKAINYKASSIKGENKIRNIYLDEKICKQIVNGTVFDKNTKLPLANTEVALFEGNQETNKSTTYSNGAFSFNINCNTNYKIVATKTDYNFNSVAFSTDNIRNTTLTKPLELIPLDCNQIVNGTVFDINTKLPLANTEITLFKGKQEANKSTTDSNGAFSFNINCNTNYKIVATKTDYNYNSVAFSTGNIRNAISTKHFELVPLDCNQILNGTVFDKNTKLPLANTEVTLFEGNQEIYKTTTVENGNYSFTIDCEVGYKIVAKNDQYELSSQNFTSTNEKNTINSINIWLNKKECNETVTGIIRDKVTKKPLPNTTISLYQNDKVIETYTVGNDGVYKFKLECSSTYKLTVFKNDYLETFKLRTVTKNNKTLILNIDIEPLACVQYINGVVKENITSNPAPNTIVVLLNNLKEIKRTLTDSNGTFYFEIECHGAYTVYTEKINYTKAQQNIFSSGKSGYPHKVDLLIEPIIQFKEKKGIKYIETKPIVFELDEYEIINEAKVELNKIIYNMNQHPTIKIEINYHTDSRGPDDYNLKLTKNRANATKDYLISKGISPDRIKANGYGETKLLNKCKNNVECSDAEHNINRRTEFIVIEK